MRLALALIPAAALLCVADDPHHTTRADIESWMKQLSNWGRWDRNGQKDQLGTYNLITADVRKRAAALVTDGEAISLAHDALLEKAPDNPDPFVRKMLYTGAHPNGQWFMDEYTVMFHGLAHTHMDSLAHTAWNKKMYNEFDPRNVTDQGAQDLAILNYKSGFFSRGVLVDIPRLKGVEYLEPGAAIYPEDLDAWEKWTGVKIGSGDIVLIRTGRWARRKAKGPWDTSRVAGLHASCVPWLKRRDVAVAGSDACLDVLPSQVDGVVQPVHQLLLVAMGTPIFDNFDLEQVSEAAARKNRPTFLLTVAPLAVPGGTGSPINPIAVF
jgi:kynurenine formamidase